MSEENEQKHFLPEKYLQILTEDIGEVLKSVQLENNNEIVDALIYVFERHSRRLLMGAKFNATNAAANTRKSPLEQKQQGTR